MGFLTGIAASVVEWLLAKLGAFLLLWGKKEIAGMKEKSIEDANVKELENAQDLKSKEDAETKLLND